MPGDKVPAFVADHGTVDDVKRIVAQGAFGIMDMCHTVLSGACFPGDHET